MTEAEVEDRHRRLLRPCPPGNATGHVRGHAIGTGEVVVTEEVEEAEVVEVVRPGIMTVAGKVAAIIDVGPTRGHVVVVRGPSREANPVPVVPIAGTVRLK